MFITETVQQFIRRDSTAKTSYRYELREQLKSTFKIDQQIQQINRYINQSINQSMQYHINICIVETIQQQTKESKISKRLASISTES